MHGPGKYDDLCTEARLKAEAIGCVLILVGGNKGQGFACQGPIEFLQTLPDVLRAVADQIEVDMRVDARRT
jgi:hypothetical protein